MSLYEKLPDDLLAGFYGEISKNIKKGILSEVMYHEIALIKAAAKKRGISELGLQEIYQKQIEYQYKQNPSMLLKNREENACS